MEGIIPSTKGPPPPRAAPKGALSLPTLSVPASSLGIHAPLAPAQGLEHPSRSEARGCQPGLGCWSSPKGAFLLQGAHGHQGGLSPTWCCGPLPAALCSLGSCTCERVFWAPPSHRAFHHNPMRPHVSGGGQQQTWECATDLWAGLLSCPYQGSVSLSSRCLGAPKAGRNALSPPPSSMSSAPCAGL